MDKQLRRDLAASALAHYRKENPNYRSGPGIEEPDEIAIVDLVADLLHLGISMGLEADHITLAAEQHVEEED